MLSFFSLHSLLWQCPSTSSLGCAICFFLHYSIPCHSCKPIHLQSFSQHSIHKVPCKNLDYFPSLDEAFCMHKLHFTFFLQLAKKRKKETTNKHTWEIFFKSDHQWNERALHLSRKKLRVNKERYIEKKGLPWLLHFKKQMHMKLLLFFKMLYDQDLSLHPMKSATE